MKYLTGNYEARDVSKVAGEVKMNSINPERNSSEGLEEVVGEMEIKETAPLVKSRTSLLEPAAFTVGSFFYGFMGEIMIPRRLIGQEFTMLFSAGIIASAFYPTPVETWLAKYKTIFLGTVLGVVAGYYLTKN